mmetsp:Transcript_16650/g.38855  ORF Transcript_16650/g.38855 Transcript_16650/m.38855 type:complete len:369 (+) Transcript_16650:1189-2295(+)
MVHEAILDCRVAAIVLGVGLLDQRHPELREALRVRAGDTHAVLVLCLDELRVDEHGEQIVYDHRLPLPVLVEAHAVRAHVGAVYGLAVGPDLADEEPQDLLVHIRVADAAGRREHRESRHEPLGLDATREDVVRVGALVEEARVGVDRDRRHPAAHLGRHLAAAERAPVRGEARVVELHSPMLAHAAARVAAFQLRQRLLRVRHPLVRALEHDLVVEALAQIHVTLIHGRVRSAHPDILLLIEPRLVLSRQRAQPLVEPPLIPVAELLVPLLRHVILAHLALVHDRAARLARLLVVPVDVTLLHPDLLREVALEQMEPLDLVRVEAREPDRDQSDIDRRERARVEDVLRRRNAVAQQLEPVLAQELLK